MRHRLAVVLLGLATLAGCGDEAQDAAAREGTYVGQVRESHASIALISDGDHLGGYLCDGMHVSVWLKGDVTEDQARLVSRRGLAVGEVRFAREQAEGHVVIDGRRRPFDTRLARGQAGLYRPVTGEPGELGSAEPGWIVLPDGSERGATNLVDPSGGETIGPAPRRTAATKAHSPRFTDSVTSD